MIILGTNSIKAAGGYDVANSLRFNSGSSDYLNRTFGTPTSSQTWTLSFWIKRCKIGSATEFVFNTDGGNEEDRLQFSSSDTLTWFEQNSGGGTVAELTTSQKFRDVSAWYHIVVARDSTQGTSSNRIKLYVNGSQVTALGTSTYPSQNDSSRWNTAVAHEIGARNGGTFVNLYMSEVVFIDGQQLAPTSFGEFDEDSGIWKPIDVSGLTFGNNGFYLDFEDSSALGNDANGSNNFPVNNLTAIDQSTDTCTNNFATLNPLIPSNGSTSNGNLDYATSNSSNNFGYRVSTIGVSSGKFYAECKYISGAWGYIGIRSFFTSTVSHQLGYYSDDYAILRDGGKIYNNNSGSTYATSWSTGDIIGVALDCDNNKLYFSKNGQWSNGSGAWDSTTFNSSVGDITIGSASSSTNGAYFFACNNWDSSTNSSFSWNYGSPAFAISSGNTDGNGYGNMECEIPSGYYVLNSKNLAEYG